MKYFDLITQEIYDIFSHLKFVETFQSAIIGPTDEAILLQYKADSGHPSPGFRFLLRTRPGIVYHVSVEGFLHTGDQAFFFIESINPNLQIVSENNVFKHHVKESFTFNFRAISNLTTVGILLNSDKKNYCLAITELTIGKVDECLVQTSQGCYNSDKLDCNPCQPQEVDVRPGCPIGPPPTVKQLCITETKPCDKEVLPKLPIETGSQNSRKIVDNSVTYDVSGKVVQILDAKDISLESGAIILELKTNQLWITDGTQFMPFQTAKETYTFYDIDEGQLWRVSSTCSKKLLR